MKIAIHQPNFIPYYGFFQKMEQVDVFVIMINCQFEKNNYQNRFQHNGWNSMSVSKKTELIKDKKYLNHVHDWDRITKKYPKLKVFNDCIYESLWLTNYKIILKARDILGIRTKIDFDYPTELKATDRLVDICKRYKATEYLSGVSGKNYLELNKFEDIKVSFQENIINKPLIELL